MRRDSSSQRLSSANGIKNRRLDRKCSSEYIARFHHPLSISEITTKPDFTYSITPDTIPITDTTKGKLSVTNDIKAVLGKIEYWHQGLIAAFKTMCRNDMGSGTGSGGM